MLISQRFKMNYYAVIGNPIAHSISPRLHNNAFEALGINSVYSRYLFDTSSSASELRQKFFALGLSGANITVPFKEIALECADAQDELAQKIGSANTLVLNAGKIHAFNTDAPGFMMAISEFKDIKNALIIGAGGTARAIAHALKANGAEVSVLNRSASRAGAFSEFCFFTTQDFKIDKNYDLIVNTTPAGLTFDGLPCDESLLNELFSSAKYAFDVVYGRKTAFLSLTKEKNLKAKDGLEMLLYQAVLAFEHFSGKKNEREKIEVAMRKALSL